MKNFPILLILIFQLSLILRNITRSLNVIAIRDDTHMTSMKIAQFSYPPTSLFHLRPKFSTPLILDVQFQTNFLPPPPPHLPHPSPNDNQSIKRKHNPKRTIRCYQVLRSGRLSFSVSTH